MAIDPADYENSGRRAHRVLYRKRFDEETNHKHTRPQRILTGLTGLTGSEAPAKSQDRRLPFCSPHPVNPVNPVKFRIAFVSSWFIPAALCLSLAGCRLPAHGGGAAP